MDSRGVNEAMRLEYFCRVMAEPIYEEMKELQEAHDSWVSFKGSSIGGVRIRETERTRSAGIVAMGVIDEDPPDYYGCIR